MYSKNEFILVIFYSIDEKRKCPRIDKTETLMMLQLYNEFPEEYTVIAEGMRENMQNLKRPVQDLYRTDPLKKLAIRIKEKIDRITAQDPSSITDIEIR